MLSTKLHNFSRHWLPELEREMASWVNGRESATTTHYGMMRYHLGWADEHFQPQSLPTGKRLRPLLCLLACAEVGGDPCQALPAAAALELLHNFSLIHDDIEDGDELRHHRSTVWKAWGVPQAINVGDGVFALAFAAMQQLTQRGVPADITLAALELFTQATIALIEGQYLDLHFEQRPKVTVDEYLRMISGKTAALLGASVAIGAQVGGASPAQVNALQRFGEQLGLAFQIQDDILGIWGDPNETGKAAGNDTLRRKKSLPILHALNYEETGAPFARLLAAELGPAQLPQALSLLAQADARSFAEDALRAHHKAAVACLAEALGRTTQQSMLFALAHRLLQRCK
jgi:geranylgeranyl diphosphate synthase type I